MMATSYSGVCVLLLCAAALLAAHAAGDGERKGGDLVAQACAYESLPNMDQKFCESMLRSDKRSAAAKHPRDLALVAVDLVERAAADADAKVDAASKQQQQQGRSKDTALVFFQYCRLDYMDVAHTVPLCRATVQAYKPGNQSAGDLEPSDYHDCANKLRDAADDCRDHVYYLDDEVKKPVFNEVADVSSRATLAKAMIHFMVPHNDDYYS